MCGERRSGSKKSNWPPCGITGELYFLPSGITPFVGEAGSPSEMEDTHKRKGQSERKVMPVTVNSSDGQKNVAFDHRMK